MVGVGSIVNPLLLAFAASNESFHEPKPSASTQTMTTGNAGSAIANLRSRVGTERKDSPEHAGLRRASVLVPLFLRRGGGDDDDSDSDDGDLWVLLTQRPQRMKSHGGEVCFPGGKQDPADGGDDVRTATREAHEEVGLRPEVVEVVARMETVESKHGLCVTPIVGLVRPPSAAEPSRLTLNADEVDAAFAVPLEYFANPANCHSVIPTKYAGRDFLMRTYLFDDPESGRQFTIWGLTAHVAHQVATMALAVNND